VCINDRIVFVVDPSDANVSLFAPIVSLVDLFVVGIGLEYARRVFEIEVPPLEAIITLVNIPFETVVEMVQPCSLILLK
jgi:hypothetical protein